MAKLLYYIIPVKFIKKVKSFKILCSILYYRKMLLTECESCKDDVRVYSPVSLKGLKYISIGNNFKLDHGGILEAWDKHNGQGYAPRIIIGNNVSIGKNCHIGSINKITIDDNVLMGSGILIIDHNHGEKGYIDINVPPNKRKLSSSGPIHICENVWIGEKATILPGITIGKNSIIGANSVVTRDVPDNVVACGNPARVIKQL